MGVALMMAGQLHSAYSNRLAGLSARVISLAVGTIAHHILVIVRVTWPVRNSLVSAWQTRIGRCV